MRILLVQGLET